MTKLRCIIAVLLLCLPLSVSAALVTNEQKITIEHIKARIAVPQEYTKEVIRQEIIEGKKGTVIIWKDPQKTGNSMWVYLDEENQITYFTHTTEKIKSTKAKESITETEALQKAWESIKKLAPQYELHLKQREITSLGDTYSCIFDIYKDNIRIYDESVSVLIDKETGDIIFKAPSYYKGTYSSAQTILDKGQIRKELLSKMPLHLIHHVAYDFGENDIKYCPLYAMDIINNKMMNAVTGDVIIPEIDRENWVREEKPKQVFYEDYLPASYLISTLVEMDKEETETFITKGKGMPKAAVETAKKYFPILKEGHITSYYLFKSNQAYSWMISCSVFNKNNKLGIDEKTFLEYVKKQKAHELPSGSYKNVMLICNALTNEIYAYDEGVEKDGNSIQVQENEEYLQNAKREVEKLIENIIPGKIKETSCIIKVTKGKDENELGRYISFNFVRMANGIPVQGNGFYVTYDLLQQKIIGYKQFWTEKELDSLDQALTQEEIAAQIELELVYIKVAKDKRILAYLPGTDKERDHTDGHMYLDPFTGKNR